MVCTDADRSSKLKRMCQNSRRDFLPGVSHLGVTLKNRMGHVASRREAGATRRAHSAPSKPTQREVGVVARRIENAVDQRGQATPTAFGDTRA